QVQTAPGLLHHVGEVDHRPAQGAVASHAKVELTLGRPFRSRHRMTRFRQDFRVKPGTPPQPGVETPGYPMKPLVGLWFRRIPAWKPPWGLHAVARGFNPWRGRMPPT